MPYTYCHISNLTNEAFYYGKGTRERAFIKTSRSKAWHEVASNGYQIVVLADWPTDEEALAHEKFLIWCARDMGINLVNVKNGGERHGHSRHWLGRKHKPESIERMSTQRIGIKLRVTKKMIEANTGTNNPNWRGTWITPDGIFDTCRQVALHYGIDTRTVRARCKGYEEQLVNGTKFYPPKDGWSFKSK